MKKLLIFLKSKIADFFVGKLSKPEVFNEQEVKDLCIYINNNKLRRKKASAYLMDCLRREKSISPQMAYLILDTLYTSSISSDIGDAVVDKMSEHKVGFGTLSPPQIAHMAEKVGLYRFIGFFDESPASFNTFVLIFYCLSEKEREQKSFKAVFARYFSTVGKCFANHKSSIPILALIKDNPATVDI